MHTVDMHVSAVLEPAAFAVEHLAAAVAPVRSGAELDWVEPAQWNVSLASFGRLSLVDLNHLEEHIAAAAPLVEPMSLQLGPVVPLPEDGDNGVWAEVAGDVEPLLALASALPRWVQPLGFVLDRRSFRTRVRLARVNVSTTVHTLEDVAAQLGQYSGPMWRVDFLTLTERRQAERADAATKFAIRRRLPFAGAEVPAQL